MRADVLRSSKDHGEEMAEATLQKFGKRREAQIL
jgi:hypothetical protein